MVRQVNNISAAPNFVGELPTNLPMILVEEMKILTWKQWQASASLIGGVERPLC